jgi:hypothetical protein
MIPTTEVREYRVVRYRLVSKLRIGFIFRRLVLLAVTRYPLYSCCFIYVQPSSFQPVAMDKLLLTTVNAEQEAPVPHEGLRGLQVRSCAHNSETGIRIRDLPAAPPPRRPRNSYLLYVYQGYRLAIITTINGCPRLEYSAMEFPNCSHSRRSRSTSCHFASDYETPY